jgi:8-oxo-dGTP pyrophosphatase MutT (NUDIX family)
VLFAASGLPVGVLLPDDSKPHGLLVESVVEQMPWTADFRLDRANKHVHLVPRDSENWAGACNEAFDELLALARKKISFPRLGKRRDELFPIIGAKFAVGIERSSFSMFGIIGRGVHMTVYTRTASGLKFWIPQRNANKSTYPNMFDNTVAGGVAYGEMPFECLLREAAEEAALSEELIRKNARAAGTVTWFNISDAKTGGELGLMNPGVLYVYDLEVGPDVVFKPVDNDVQAFHLMDENQVKVAMGSEMFKPSCALVMMDFFIRHGYLTAENEPDYVEIVSRLHRKLPFPTSPGA